MSSIILKDLKDTKRLIGFDTSGELFQDDERILRVIYPESGPLYYTVLKICEQNNLFQFGIVQTREKEKGLGEDIKLNLILEHERIPFISYPHEWPVSMIKDAALFHIDLFIELEKYGLTLKDWHPYNVLFKGVNPVFVDFLSIIPIDNLEKEEYLSLRKIPSFISKLWDTRSKYLYRMYQIMYLPYFLFPLMILGREKGIIARNRIYQTTMNASNSCISKSDIFKTTKERIGYELNESLKKIFLIEPGKKKNKFFNSLKKELNQIAIIPTSSGYVDYYQLKNESFEFQPTSNWTKKQIGIYNALKESKPHTVLDVACNTGWFSILAAKMGSNVVSIDIDEECVERLYQFVKLNKLPILPLVIDIVNIKSELFPLPQKNDIYQKRMMDETPLIYSIETRIQCDMVFALALIHHLALGQNLSFAQIVKRLYSLTKKILILEFVTKKDTQIIEYTFFFPALHAQPEAFEWYTQKNLMIELHRFFKKVEIFESYPESRYLLICYK